MIDPGGLKVRGADRNGAIRTLAENTDGLAILNTNDLDKGFTRIADDMSSYYLLGYYASQHQARRPLPHHHRPREAAGRLRFGRGRATVHPTRRHQSAGRDHEVHRRPRLGRCRKRSIS